MRRQNASARRRSLTAAWAFAPPPDIGHWLGTSKNVFEIFGNYLLDASGLRRQRRILKRRR
jgi:hypothetical protein